MSDHIDTPHTAWCARDHRCNLSEHRADDIIVSLPGTGRALLTRVRSADTREYAEIRIRLALAPTEPAARRQLGALLSGLRTLLDRTATAGRPAPGWPTTGRPAPSWPTTGRPAPSQHAPGGPGTGRAADHSAPGRRGANGAGRPDASTGRCDTPTDGPAGRPAPRRSAA